MMRDPDEAKLEALHERMECPALSVVESSGELAGLWHHGPLNNQVANGLQRFNPRLDPEQADAYGVAILGNNVAGTRDEGWQLVGEALFANRPSLAVHGQYPPEAEGLSLLDRLLGRYSVPGALARSVGIREDVPSIPQLAHALRAYNPALRWSRACGHARGLLEVPLPHEAWERVDWALKDMPPGADARPWSTLMQRAWVAAHRRISERVARGAPPPPPWMRSDGEQRNTTAPPALQVRPVSVVTHRVGSEIVEDPEDDGQVHVLVWGEEPLALPASPWSYEGVEGIQRMLDGIHQHREEEMALVGARLERRLAEAWEIAEAAEDPELADVLDGRLDRADYWSEEADPWEAESFGDEASEDFEDEPH